MNSADQKIVDREAPAGVRLAGTLLGMSCVLLFLLSLGPAIGGLVFSGPHVMIPGMCGLLLASWGLFLANRMQVRDKWVRISSLCWAGVAIFAQAFIWFTIYIDRDPNIVLVTIFTAFGMAMTIPILVAMLIPSARAWFG